ncbi:MAG: hypothetical protein OEW15_12565 [Nitrospirota bacterium]|nr:hypothetical protein [Nitrospirota bacterium]
MPRKIEKTVRTTFIIVAIFGLLVAVSHAGNEHQQQFHVLKISPQDHAAVMRIDNGPAKLVRVGEKVGKDGKVTEIAEGRVVIEEGAGKDVETVIIRVERGTQTVERIKKVADPKPMLLAPGK